MAGRGDIEAGKAHIMLYVKNSALVKGLNAAKKQLQGLGTGIMKIGGFLSGLGAAIIAPLVGAVATFSAMGSELADMSARTGMAAGALAEYKFAAEQSGASLDDVEKSTKKMAKTIVDADRGLKTAKQSLAMVGLTASDLKGKLPDEQFQLIADRLADIEDPMLRTVAAQELLGKSGTKLLPMIENLRALRQEARDLGLVPTEEAVKMADDVGDAVDKIKSVLAATVFEVGAALAPMLLPALDAVKNIAAWFNRWAKQNGAIIRTVALIAAGVLAAGVAVTAIGATVFGLGTAFGLAASAVTAIGGAVGFLLSPMGLLIALVVGGVAAWARFTASGQAAVRGIGALLGPMVETLRTAVGGIGDALAAGDLELAGQIAIKGLQVVFLQGIAGLADMLGGTLGDAVGTIGTQVLQGDLAGAWQTVVKGMATLWADFAEGMVAIFTVSARAVTDLWQSTINSITDSILKQSSQGGAMGKFWSTILGVDLQKEQARLDKINREGARLGTFNTSQTSVTDQAQADARAQTAATADAARKFLDGIDQSFREQSDAARQDFETSIAGGGSKARDEAARLAAELAELRNQAAQAREAAAARSAAGVAPSDVAGLGGPEELKQSASGTFSAAGAAALGFGGGATARIARGVEELGKKGDEQIRLQKESGKALTGIAAALVLQE